MHFDTKDLATKETVESLVESHHKEVTDVKEVWSSIKAKEYLDIRAEGHRAILFNLDGEIMSRKKKAWEHVIKKLKVKETCSDKRMQEITRQIEKGDMPDFTQQNILALIDSFAQSMPEYFKEAIEEIIDWIRPPQWDKYKTNDKNAKYEIGRKIIKSGAVDAWGVSGVSIHAEGKLRSLDNVFHLLAGKGTSKYPDDIVTKINDAARAHKDSIKTDFFRIKWYKNCNMHIEFLDAKILAEFNAIAHGKALRDPNAPEAQKVKPKTEKKEPKKPERQQGIFNNQVMDAINAMRKGK